MGGGGVIQWTKNRLLNVAKKKGMRVYLNLIIKINEIFLLCDFYKSKDLEGGVVEKRYPVPFKLYCTMKTFNLDWIRT